MLAWLFPSKGNRIKANMRMKSNSGFNLIGLAAITVAVMLFVIALVPAISNSVMSANMTAVGTRGRDIFVAIEGANAERQLLGMPKVWPSDNAPFTRTNSSVVECFNFSNSTDYFKYLYDEKNFGTDKWSPFVAGFDYSKLKGGGVPSCTNSVLTAACNMWTVAKNVRDDMNDIVPVLITRNIDVSSLAAKVTAKDGEKKVRFDSEWKTPFGERDFVLVRKGGAIFKARAKYMSYHIIYQNNVFDTTVENGKQPLVNQLKYLTPTHEIVPSEQIFDEGLERETRLSGGLIGQVIRDLKALGRLILPLCFAWGIAYLAAFGVYTARRWSKKTAFRLIDFGIGVGLFHYATVVLYSVFVLEQMENNFYRFRWTLLALAVAMQLAGIAFVILRRRSDRMACQRGIKWMVTAPLALGVAGVILIAVFIVA